MLIDFYGSEEGVKTMLQLVKIGLKAHHNNPSPVDIKQQLAELPADMLMQLEDDLSRVTQQSTPVNKKQ